MKTSDGALVKNRYVSLKLHFNSDSYDFFKYNGKIKVSNAVSKDDWRFESLGRKYKHDEATDYILANIINGKTWIGDFTDKSYTEWRKRVESFQYHLREQLEVINDESDGNVENMWRRNMNVYPTVLRMFLGNALSLETMAATEMVLKYTTLWDKEYPTDIVIPQYVRLIRKYVPFISQKIDKNIVTKLMSDVFRNNTKPNREAA